MRNQKAIEILSTKMNYSHKHKEAYELAINALESQIRADELYHMACKRADENPENMSKYELGRLSALADVTGHTMQTFSPDLDNVPMEYFESGGK